mmetsp:Transcript_45224/g.137115  ORF Transcript_45224/g.137115 Transcript_45224/m.137115 type:complete len:242 (+) Transcript_45224:291-1016(+)
MPSHGPPASRICPGTSGGSGGPRRSRRHGRPRGVARALATGLFGAGAGRGIEKVALGGVRRRGVAPLGRRGRAYLRIRCAPFAWGLLPRVGRAVWRADARVAYRGGGCRIHSGGTALRSGASAALVFGGAQLGGFAAGAARGPRMPRSRAWGSLDRFGGQHLDHARLDLGHAEGLQLCLRGDPYLRQPRSGARRDVPEWLAGMVRPDGGQTEGSQDEPCARFAKLDPQPPRVGAGDRRAPG